MLLYKNGSSDAAVTNRLLLRRKRTLVWTNAIPYIIEDQNLFKRIWINRSRHHHRWRRGDRKVLNGKELLGHWHLLQSRWTLKLTRLLPRSVFSICNSLHCCRAVSNWFLASLALCCWQDKRLSWSKINTAILEPFDDLGMWKESQTYRLFC